MLGLFHVFPNVLEDYLVDGCCWLAETCQWHLFLLQATLQTSPSGHTTSFQMFNHTYKLYSYRLVVEKRAQVAAFCEASETEGFFWSGVLANEYREEKLGPRNFGGLTLAAHHVPSPSIIPILLTGQGGENMTKSSWVKMRTERSPATVIGKTDLTLI